MHQRVIAIIPARANSRRLPHKLLRPLGGQPVIAQVLGLALAGCGREGLPNGSDGDTSDSGSMYATGSGDVSSSSSSSSSTGATGGVPDMQGLTCVDARPCKPQWRFQCPIYVPKPSTKSSTGF